MVGGIDVTNFEWAQLFMSAMAGVLTPVLIVVLNAHRNERNRRLDHLDECFDDMKTRILGELVTKKDLDAYSIEMGQTLSRMREAISKETNGLHERLMRLENGYFFKPPV